MSEQNTLKKTLKIEAAFVDFTRLTDEKLACYEKVEIDAASVILSESAQAVLQKYSHNINAASIITVPDGCTVDTKNGSYTLAPTDKASGLKEAMKVLRGIDDIAICTLTGADVVRHVLVQKIIEAYEKHDKANQPVSKMPIPPHRFKRKP